MEVLFAVLLGHLPHLFCLLWFSSFFPPYHWCSFFYFYSILSSPVITFLHLTLFNSLNCLFQFHCPTFHILNLHSFCLLHYSFFISFILVFSCFYCCSLPFALQRKMLSIVSLHHSASIISYSLCIVTRLLM